MTHLTISEKEKNSLEGFFDGDYIAIIKKVLHPFDGFMQDAHGHYKRRVRMITDQDWIEHFTGRESLALCVCTNPSVGKPKARFAAFDIDRNFQERKTYYAAALKELGIDRAAFCTDGSAPEKGKVLLCFQEMIPKKAAYDLSRVIHERAYHLAHGGLPREPVNGDLEIYPKNSADRVRGGILRVLGRHIYRNGPLETATQFNGAKFDFLKALYPISRARVMKIVAERRALESFDEAPESIKRLVKGPWLYATSGDLKRILRNLFRLACYFAMKYQGAAEGEDRYRASLQQVLLNSPGLPGTSNKSASGDDRNPVERELKSLSAWKKACEQRWRPKFVSDTTAGKRGYDALALHVRKNGLVPHCFGVTEKMLADMMGVYPNAARKQLKSTQKSGLLLKLHPGRPCQLVLSQTGTRRLLKGDPATYALLGDGQSLTSVWMKASTDKMLMERFRALPVGPYDDPRKMEIVPCLRFWLAYTEYLRKHVDTPSLRVAA